MTSTIPPEFTQFVEQEVASGRYRSAEELVSEGLRLIQERERRRNGLREKVKIGLDQLDRGEGTELDEESLGSFLDEIEDEVRREMAAAKNPTHSRAAPRMCTG